MRLKPCSSLSCSASSAESLSVSGLKAPTNKLTISAISQYSLSLFHPLFLSLVVICIFIHLDTECDMICVGGVSVPVYLCQMPLSIMYRSV